MPTSASTSYNHVFVIGLSVRVWATWFWYSYFGFPQSDSLLERLWQINLYSLHYSHSLAYYHVSRCPLNPRHQHTKVFRLVSVFLSLSDCQVEGLWQTSLLPTRPWGNHRRSPTADAPGRLIGIDCFPVLTSCYHGRHAAYVGGMVNRAEGWASWKMGCGLDLFCSNGSILNMIVALWSMVLYTFVQLKSIDFNCWRGARHTEAVSSFQ